MSRAVALALSLLLLAPGGRRLEARPGPAKKSAETSPATVVGRYRLQSNAWVNLHQRLLYEARFGPVDAPAGLAGDDVAAWKDAVDKYRAWLGRRSPIFDEELAALDDALSAAGGADLPDGIPKAADTILRSAMPLYRKGQWELDDRANRFWIAVAVPLLDSAGEELAEAHAKAYGTPFPTHILVDAASFGWEFGAYTVGEGDHAHAVIMSTNPGTQGFAALESLMHEPSHAIVAPSAGAVGSDLQRASVETGLKPMASLWHAILFYTSSELTRQALAKRGVVYHPIMEQMYDRGFRDYRQALETHWQGYLDGKETREAAIRQILIETSPAGK